MKQTILFLRNGNLFASKEAALTGIKAVAHVAGQPVVALYGEAGSVKLIFAIGTEEGKCEIMATDADLAALAGLVAQLRTDVDALTNSGIDDKISAAIDALKGEGFDAANLAALEDSVDANTAALVKLNGAETEDGSVAKAVKEAKEAAISAAAADAKSKIEALDVDEIKKEGEYIVAVSEVDGKISATTKQIEASEVAFADAENHFTATNVEGALEELYSQAGAGSKVTMTSTAGSGDVATIYKFYQGGEDADHLVGEINIGKEMFIESGEVIEKEGVPFLKLTLNDTAKTVLEIDLTQVMDVYTNGNGINVDANVISVKKATDSEAFLVVDENGVAVKGVQDAINAAVKSAKDTIDAYTVNGKAISTNPVLGGADINYADGVTVNAKIDEVAKAVADEADRATKAEEALTDLIEDINAEAGKVKVDEADTADYLENKVVSGTADEANNTYAATVTKADNKLNITVKIDKIDGGTY